MVVAPSRVNVYDVGFFGIGVIEGRRPLDGLPGLVQLKCTASQRWQVRLIWVKLGGSATAGIRADHTQTIVTSSSFGLQNYFRKPFSSN